jgi:hypothetical protein
VTGAAERVKAIRERLEHADWTGLDLVRDDMEWLADQLDRSVDREAAALATPPGRLASLEAVAEAVVAWASLPGMFLGDTPETGSGIGAALRAAGYPAKTRAEAEQELAGEELDTGEATR